MILSRFKRPAYGVVSTAVAISLLGAGQASAQTQHSLHPLSTSTKSHQIYLVKRGNTGQAVIRSGEQFMGTRYVWGGNTPHPGFDCSGFVQYVFAENGIHLPRTAHEQAAVGTAVSKQNLQPGDLLFFSNTDSYAKDYANHVTHVGIYAGNGNMLESTSANNDQGVVIISNVFQHQFYASHFYGARRVIQ